MHNPVYQSLIEHHTVAGVESKLMLANTLFSFSMTLFFHFPAFLLIGYASHLLLRKLCQKDPLIRSNYMRYNRQKDRYEPQNNSLPPSAQ